MSFEQRVQQFRNNLATQECDIFLVSQPDNRRYLTGYTAEDHGADSAGTLLVSQDSMVLITDPRFTEQAKLEAPGCELYIRQGDFATAFAGVVRNHGWTRVGFEAHHVTVSMRDDLEKAGDGAYQLLPTRDIIEKQRQIKDASELEAIHKAIEITDETFTHLLGYIKPGLTEKQVALEIQNFMIEQGADGLAFPSIVASGPNAALPHAIPGDRKIQQGDCLIIDMGAKYAGYCADMTRTVYMGKPDEKFVEVYNTVLQAQENGEQQTKAGITGKAADAFCRDVIEKAGYGPYFGHGTGHALGLEIHENPRLSKYSQETLEPRMAVTVEPGIYLAGWGGVRIEDTGIISEDKLVVLTKSPKDLICL